MSMVAIEKYRPTSCTGADSFITDWCCLCQRDKSMRDDEEICSVIAKTLVFSIDDPEYPDEWRFDDYGIPFCTAFVPAGTPIPPLPDTLSGDLFERMQS